MRQEFCYFQLWFALEKIRKKWCLSEINSIFNVKPIICSICLLEKKYYCNKNTISITPWIIPLNNVYHIIIETKDLLFKCVCNFNEYDKCFYFVSYNKLFGINHHLLYTMVPYTPSCIRSDKFHFPYDNTKRQSNFHIFLCSLVHIFLMSILKDMFVLRLS